MNRSVAVALAWALAVLPVMHDVCGPECAMGDVATAVAVAAPEVPVDGVEGGDGGAECPLHPSEDPAPTHQTDGCSHEHGIVREAPESTSALGPSVSQPLQLPAGAFSLATLPVKSPRVVRAAAAPPIARFPRSLALRI